MVKSAGFLFENSRKCLCAGHDRLIATNNKLKVGAHRERFFSSSSSKRIEFEGKKNTKK